MQALGAAIAGGAILVAMVGLGGCATEIQAGSAPAVRLRVAWGASEIRNTEKTSHTRGAPMSAGFGDMVGDMVDAVRGRPQVYVVPPEDEVSGPVPLEVQP